MSLSVALAILTATSTACGPKRVTVGGVEMSYDDGARTLMSQGVDAERQGDDATAKARYQEVVNNYHGSPSEPDALASLGLLLYREGGCAPSRAYLERLAVEHPTHPRASQAKTLLNECPTTTGGSTVAAATPTAEVLSTYERRFGEATSPAAKREVASAAADAALAAGDGAAAVRWLLRVRDQEPEPAQRSALEAEIREVIDQHVSFVDVRRLVETLPGRDFPRPLLLYKLGRIQYHVRDYAGAQESLNDYLKDEPSGEHAAGAQHLLARMSALATVSPTKVGVLLPLSGKHRSYGELALQTVRLALGVDKSDRGPGVELVVRDTKSDAVVAAQMAESLIIEDHVVAILGPVFSYAAVPAARVAQQLGTPILTISTADELPELGPYVFRNALTNRDQVEALVDYAMNILQMRTFAVLYPRHPYGEEMLQLFWDAVEKRRGEIKGVESYAMTDTTFTTQVKRLVARDVLNLRGDFKRAEQECDKQPDSYRKARCKDEVKKNLKPIVDFDGLFIPDYPRTIPMISAALAFEDIIVETDPRRLRIIEKTLGRKVKPVTLMGGSGWNSSQVPERSGRNVENALFTDGFFPEADDKVVAEFVNAYQKAYRRTPRLYPEALFWDSARMLGQVLRTQHPTTREALRAGLSGLRDFPGVSGPTSFGGANDAKRPVRILTIKNGRIQDIPDPDAPPQGGEPTETPTEP
ncbi:MAG: penicillin-binding protein activator [Myxococcales bacterium]|nr:penicillin-binding protein activator [Myxococcales bacterium]